MTLVYGSAKDGIFTQVRYSRAQLLKGSIIEDIISRGFTIHPMDDGTRETREVSNVEQANIVTCKDDLQTGLFEYHVGSDKGVVPLDDTTTVVNDFLADGVMEYKGDWNPITNTPLLLDGIGRSGNLYLVAGVPDDGYVIDLGSGDMVVYNEDYIQFRRGVYNVVSSPNISVAQRKVLDNAMQNLVTYSIASPLEPIVCPQGVTRHVQVSSDNTPYPEYVLNNHGGLVDCTIHPSSGELTVIPGDAPVGTYTLDVRVGGRLGQGILFPIYVEVTSS